jgi:hypothetical protein
LIWASSKKTHCIVCTKYVQPFSDKIHTLRDVAKHCNLKEFKSAFLQVLLNLLYLQKTFPGFRHNDLKADNVLITQLKNAKTYQLQTKTLTRIWKIPPGPYAVLIDFELAYCTDETLCSYSVKEGSESFGLNTHECTFFDVHLLLYDILSNVNSVIAQSVWEFTLAFIPEKYFQKQNLTKEFRLKFEDQQSLRVDLHDMVSHSFFHEFRQDESTIIDMII